MWVNGFKKEFFFYIFLSRMKSTDKKIWINKYLRGILNCHIEGAPENIFL